MRVFKLWIFSLLVVLLVVVAITLTLHQRPHESQSPETMKSIKESNDLDSTDEPLGSPDAPDKFTQKPLVKNHYSSRDIFFRRMRGILDSFKDATSSDQRRILELVEEMFMDLSEQNGGVVPYSDFHEFLILSQNNDEVTSMLIFWASINNYYESIDSKSKTSYCNYLLGLGKQESDSLSIVSVGALRRLIEDIFVFEFTDFFGDRSSPRIGLSEFRDLANSDVVDLADQTFLIGVNKLNDSDISIYAKLSIISELNKLLKYGLLNADRVNLETLRIVGNESNDLQVKYRWLQILNEENLISEDLVKNDLMPLIESSEDMEFKRLSEGLLSSVSSK